MKKVKVSCLVVVFVMVAASVVMFSGIARAGEVPDGFMGIPWGASGDQIIKTMKERGYQQVESMWSPMAFRGAFDGIPCYTLNFSLKANSFYSGLAIACNRSDYPSGPQATYKKIVDKLSEKYGPPTYRNSGKIKTNQGRELPNEVTEWDLVDSRTSDRYIINVAFGVTWFTDKEGDQYVVDIFYSANSLGERLEKKKKQDY